MAKLQPFQSVKGMHDILPQDQAYWDMVRTVAAGVIEGYGFERIDPPVLEPAELFLRAVGEATDVVEKQMYMFKTRGGDMLTLRPEFTASILRAYLEHGFYALAQPIKLWYQGPAFRHEAPGAGRYRQFWQVGAEVIGEANAVLDAEVMQALYAIFFELGIADAMVHINSIGDATCRPVYRKILVSYYRNKREKLCKDCKRRLTVNPLRLLDCKEESCQALREDAPQSMDHLCEACHKHFREVIEFLDELNLPYLLDPYLVRGLDYYTRTVFEYFVEEPEEGAEEARPKPDGPGILALGGGGRYDGLVELLGGKPTPAVGWAAGMERIVDVLKRRNVRVRYPHEPQPPRIFLAQLGDIGKRKSVKLFEVLRRAGIAVAQAFSKDSLRVQLHIADRLGVTWTLILGQKEALGGMIIVREMTSGIQETVPLGNIVEELKKRIKLK